jgi:acyl carrier protein
MDKEIGKMSIELSTEFTSTESVVARIWEKELSATGITPGSDFFELGGDSLQMLNLLFQIKVALGVELSPAALFENSSLRAFSRVVDLAVDMAAEGSV